MVEICRLETKITPGKHRILNCLRETIYDFFFLLRLKRVNDRKQYISHIIEKTRRMIQGRALLGVV